MADRDGGARPEAAPDKLLSQLEELLFKFRSCFRRTQTWQWFVVIIAGFIVRQDFLGISSMARWLCLPAECYETMLRFFRSSAWELNGVAAAWAGVCAALDSALLVNGRRVIAGDHTLTPKEGTKSPDVQLLTQNSQTSSKPQRFRGQCWGFVALVAGRAGDWLAIPLRGWLEPSRAWSPAVGDRPADAAGDAPAAAAKNAADSSGKESLIIRMFNEGLRAAKLLGSGCYLLLDAYFPSGAIFRAAARELMDGGQPWIHIVTRAKNSFVAYDRSDPANGAEGLRIKLKSLFGLKDVGWTESELGLYGSGPETVRWIVRDLFWPPAAAVLRFIWCSSPRGSIVLMTTDLGLTAEDAIALFARRTTIESMFYAIKHVMGGLYVRFWSWFAPAQSRRRVANDSQPVPAPGVIPHLERLRDAAERMANLAGITVGICQILGMNLAAGSVGTELLWQRTSRGSSLSVRLMRQIAGRWIIEGLLGQKIHKNRILAIIAQKRAAGAAGKEAGEAVEVLEPQPDTKIEQSNEHVADSSTKDGIPVATGA